MLGLLEARTAEPGQLVRKVASLGGRIKQTASFSLLPSLGGQSQGRVGPFSWAFHSCLQGFSEGKMEIRKVLQTALGPHCGERWAMNEVNKE